MLSETLGLMEPLAVANGITMSATTDGEYSVNADRRRLMQALLNLASNAIKYNRPGGDVHFAVRELDDEVAIAVTDTGMGIPAEDLPRLFHPFDRLGWETSAVEGTGIGLTLTQRLVTMMSGRLDVSSTDGVGSTFTITLPNATHPSSLTRTSEPADGHQSPPVVAQQRWNLLYVEDNPANVALLRAAIGHRPGWTLTHASNGRDGLRLAVQVTPTLILLDLHLPDIDGAQVLQQLKDNPASSAVPVAILSADANPDQVARLLAIGADCYLTKPVDLPKLFTLLDDHAGRNGRQQRVGSAWP